MNESSTFTAMETHGRVLRPGNRLLVHSEDAGWRSLYAAVFEEAPFEARESALGHASLIYHLSRPTRVMRRIVGAQREQALIGPRQFCLTPGQAVTQWCHSGRPKILQVYLRKSIYERSVQEMYGADVATAEILPRFAIVDPLLEQLAIALLSALHDGSSEDGLYVDTMAQMIAVHLARKHSSRSRPERAAPAERISRHKIRQLIEFIEDHLGGDLSLEAMAAEVSLSPLYLSRVFKAAVGQSPHQYVVTRRVERVKQMLRDADTPISQVAFSAGFSSQSHMSNWFRRLVGVSPAVYRRQL